MQFSPYVGALGMMRKGMAANRVKPADRCANIDAAPPAVLPATDGKGVTNRDTP